MMGVSVKNVNGNGKSLSINDLPRSSIIEKKKVFPEKHMFKLTKTTTRYYESYLSLSHHHT